MTLDNSEWQALLARGSRIRKEARALAEKGTPLRFQSEDGRKYLVSPDMNYPPEFGIWRVTSFCLDGQPFGHCEYASAYEAFREVLNSGCKPVIKETVSC